ncbi:hypothetical protein ACQEUU_13020 [Nonomuraea sp. CA-218870]|uniref:hypothetical protein n=1 Tax=Nonomuraea sp. CA-218870 TaxID=3239998 RepID=UPI003D8B6069
MASRPKVLILDEPATGLTTNELDALARLCRALRERGLAVALIEHNVDFVMNLCDETTVLESGKVIERGSPERVRNLLAVARALMGDPRLLMLDEPSLGLAPLKVIKPGAAGGQRGRAARRPPRPGRLPGAAPRERLTPT